jgi:hypothetical protein
MTFKNATEGLYIQSTTKLDSVSMVSGEKKAVVRILATAV